MYNSSSLIQFVCMHCIREMVDKDQRRGRSGNIYTFKMDQKLFRRYTKNAQGCSLSDCQFADDAVYF